VPTQEPAPRLIKKYSNRKLYDTSSRRYITLERIGELVRTGENIRVVDRSNGEDLTAVTLSQVVLDNERKRHGAVPEQLLQQLVRNPGEAVIGAVRQSRSTASQTSLPIAYDATAPWAFVQNGHWLREETNAAKSSRSPADQSDGPRIARSRASEKGRPKRSGR
jgi:polyhydroxyalkanoate synthesis repressor PhaR